MFTSKSKEKPIDICSSSFRYNASSFKFEANFGDLPAEVQDALKKEAPIRILSKKTGYGIEFSFVTHLFGAYKSLSTRSQIRGWGYLGKRPDNGFSFHMNILL